MLPVPETRQFASEGKAAAVKDAGGSEASVEVRLFVSGHCDRVKFGTVKI